MGKKEELQVLEVRPHLSWRRMLLYVWGPRPHHRVDRV